MESLERRVLMSVVFKDDFEAYAGDAAFRTVWDAEGVPAYAFDPTFGRDSDKSVKLVDPGRGTGTSDRYYVDLPSPVTATEAMPVVFAFDLYLDPAGAATGWRDAFHLADIRGYARQPSGAPGGVTGVLAVGVSRGSLDPWSASHFQGRILSRTSPTAYYTLDASATAPGRSGGWHRLVAEVTPSSTSFYVDGRFAELRGAGIGTPFTRVVIGSGSAAGGHTMWLDNVVVQRRDTAPPTARVLADGRQASLVRHQLNRRGYLDVTFTSAVGRGIDPASVTDPAPEFALSGDAAAGVSVSAAPVQVDASTYRYAFAGRFGRGPVEVDFLTDAWSDGDGNGNAASRQHLRVAGGAPELGRAQVLDVVRRMMGFGRP